MSSIDELYTVWSNDGNSTKILPLSFPLLLLLIVIYDGVGTYDEMIIMDWGLYTIITSIYDQLGDSVDCSI